MISANAIGIPVASTAFHSSAVLISSAVVVAPLVEEVIFRGYLYPVFKRFSDRFLAAIVTSMMFALVHGNVPGTLPLFALALMLTIAYELTGCLEVVGRAVQSLDVDVAPRSTLHRTGGLGNADEREQGNCGGYESLIHHHASVEKQEPCRGSCPFRTAGLGLVAIQASSRAGKASSRADGWWAHL